MPAFNVEVPHSLGQAAAKERLESFLDAISEKYKDQISDLDGKWTDHVLDFAFTTFGIKVKGEIAALDDRVALNGELPMAAMIFKGKITSGIQEALQKALA